MNTDQKENKKIKNTKSTFYNNISFRSKLEVSCYKKLETSGLKFKYFEYEPEKIILWEGSKISNIDVYVPSKNKKLKSLKGKKLINITYTPDFKLIYKDYIIYYDIKGFSNDTYPMKKKMFIQYLNNKGSNFIFFEPHSVTQMLETIEIIKKL